MKISFDDLENAGYDKVVKLKNMLDSWLESYEDRRWIEVTILNYEGNVSKKIKEKFKDFVVNWHTDQAGTIGENKVWVPAEMWNDEVARELAKFDSFVGHHVEKHDAYVVREDVDLPFDLKQEVDHRRSIAKGNRKNLDKIVVSAWEFNNNYVFKKHYGDLDKYFIKTEVIDREWDDKLWVRDSRQYVNLDNLKKLSVEI